MAARKRKTGRGSKHLQERVEREMIARVRSIGRAAKRWHSAPSGIADALISVQEISRIADFCGTAFHSLPEGERDKILADAGKDFFVRVILSKPFCRFGSNFKNALEATRPS
jgi:hypothetical protein